MKLITTKTLGTLILTLCLTSTANAALFSRLGGDALYDDVLDITWLSNANDQPVWPDPEYQCI